MVMNYTNMMMGNFVKEDDHIKMLRPAFFSCGCGSIISRLGSVLQFVNLHSNQLPQIKPNASVIAKEWLKQEGMYDKCPLLNQHVYGVFITPDGKWLDISQGTTQNVAERFKALYDEYSNN